MLSPYLACLLLIPSCRIYNIIKLYNSHGCCWRSLKFFSVHISATKAWIDKYTMINISLYKLWPLLLINNYFFCFINIQYRKNEIISVDAKNCTTLTLIALILFLLSSLLAIILYWILLSSDVFWGGGLVIAACTRITTDDSSYTIKKQF